MWPEPFVLLLSWRIALALCRAASRLQRLPGPLTAEKLDGGDALLRERIIKVWGLGLWFRFRERMVKVRVAAHFKAQRMCASHAIHASMQMMCARVRV